MKQFISGTSKATARANTAVARCVIVIFDTAAALFSRNTFGVSDIDIQRAVDAGIGRCGVDRGGSDPPGRIELVHRLNHERR